MARYSDILLTVDYDRTLTAPDSTIPQNNLEAIRYFMENGGTFTVNTGRSVPMARSFLNKVPVNAPLLLYNGSAAYDPAAGKLSQIHEIPLDPWETIRACRELLPDLMVEIQGVKAHYRFWENPAWDAFCDHNRCARAFARPGDDLGPFLKFSVYGAFHDETVNSLFSGTAEELRRIDEAERLLTRRFGDVCQVFRSAARILDIHVRGVSKARSARELNDSLGGKILVCAGDAQNDLAMMADADFAFAPADGVIAGDFPNVCPCAEGAVAEIVYEKIPKM